MAKETHYVAQLKVERVDRIIPEPVRGGYNQPDPTPEKREISEVTHMTIKGDDLVRLLEKLRSHIALVEDE